MQLLRQFLYEFSSEENYENCCTSAAFIVKITRGLLFLDMRKCIRYLMILVCDVCYVVNSSRHVICITVYHVCYVMNPDCMFGLL